MTNDVTLKVTNNTADLIIRNGTVIANPASIFGRFDLVAFLLFIERR